MSELNNFFKVLENSKKDTPKYRAKKIDEEVKQNIKSDLSSLLSELSDLTKKEVEPTILKEVITEVKTISTPIGEVPAAAQTSADSNTLDVDKYLKTPVFSAPKPEVVDHSRELKLLSDKFKFLEQWVGKINNAGPGSGEVNFRWLDDVNRSSIDKDRYLMYDAATKKFLFVDTRVSIEAFDRTASIPLLATPQLLKPSSFTNSKNLTYDAATGIFTFLTQCEVSLTISLNALASASNQRVYQYAERNTGSGWTPIQNSGKSYQLGNNQHNQIVNAQTISRLAGEQIRYFIYASDVNKVTLITETLPNITDGTVYIPAIRIQYAGR